MNDTISKLARQEGVHDIAFFFGEALLLKHLGIMTAQQCGPVVGTASTTNRHAKDGGAGSIVVIAIASDREVAPAHLFQFFDHVTRAGCDPFQRPSYCL